jgi:hypothetical protein
MHRGIAYAQWLSYCAEKGLAEAAVARLLQPASGGEHHAEGGGGCPRLPTRLPGQCQHR